MSKTIAHYPLLILLIMSFSFSLNSYASSNDNLENITISSDTFNIDYANGHAVYVGHVKLNQGSRNILAETLYIYFAPSDKNKNKNKTNSNFEIKEIVANGQPVQYSELLTTAPKSIKAKARQMKFTLSSNLVTLQDSAVIQHNGKVLSSNLLHYNIKTEVAYSPKQQNQRSKLIIG